MARDGSGSEAYFRGLNGLEEMQFWSREGETLRATRNALTEKRRAKLTDVAILLSNLVEKRRAEQARMQQGGNNE